METAREKNLTISNLQSNDWRSWSNRGFKRLFDVFGPPSSTAVRAWAEDYGTGCPGGKADSI